MAIKSRINIFCDQPVHQEVFESKYKQIVEDINIKIKNKQTLGHKNLSFFNVAKNIQDSDYLKIKKILNFFNEEKIQVLVVIAPEFICLQSQALINLANLNSFFKIEILFINESYDGIEIARLIQYLENKRFAINVISKSGEDIETLIAFREIASLLINKIGRNNATKYIFVSTNNNYGKLFNWTQSKKYTHLVILDNTTERFLNYSVATLLPLICANINIDEYIEGAKEANEFYENTTLSNNPAYKYAIVRYVMNKRSQQIDEKEIFALENIVVTSKSLKKLANLFAMYLNATSYRKHIGLQTNVFLHPSDAKTYTNLFFERQRKMFDTYLVIKNFPYDFHVATINENEMDDLNYLINYSYNKINDNFKRIVKDYHLSLRIPFIEIIIEDLSSRSLGWIIAFIHRSAIMSSYLMNLDPFEDNGLKTYNIEVTKKITELIGGNKND
ncbi:hypothetical protein [Metamycoplasma canadense]|uniref:Glucose-6-phosphate isomerase n=1 Tax=Metamycoplasma canadense TaxID=29554 RepID=A0A077L6T9_9BACT|nr:hypothetical protein [Metamycoplasma canadense]BAP39506.1 glucose-6-phosphate isomerase [Metamycoplasma canadense]